MPSQDPGALAALTVASDDCPSCGLPMPRANVVCWTCYRSTDRLTIGKATPRGRVIDRALLDQWEWLRKMRLLAQPDPQPELVAEEGARVWHFTCAGCGVKYSQVAELPTTDLLQCSACGHADQLTIHSPHGPQR